MLLADGEALARTPAVRVLLETLLSEGGKPTPELAQARDQFWAAHAAEVRLILDRAVNRGEIRVRPDPLAVIDMIIGPAMLRMLFMGLEVNPAEREQIVDRTLGTLAAGADDE
jgi:hypothetical protein